MSQIIPFVFNVWNCCWHRSSQIDYLAALGAAGLISVILDAIAPPNEGPTGISRK